jgi:hypothetical protein
MAELVRGNIHVREGECLKAGTRNVTAVTEVAGMEGEIIVLTGIFKFAQTGVGEGGKALGELKATGIRPSSRLAWKPWG